MTMDEVCRKLYMSRSTYFRYHKAAIIQLEKKYNDNKTEQELVLNK
jgi:ACT domain-containing protein